MRHVELFEYTRGATAEYYPQIEEHEGEDVLGVLCASLSPNPDRGVYLPVHAGLEEERDDRAESAEGGKVALAFLNFDVDFFSSFCHNRCTPLVKVCVPVNTTLLLFYEQSRGDLLFPACGFGRN